jgi:hypothetical protein
MNNSSSSISCELAMNIVVFPCEGMYQASINRREETDQMAPDLYII